jgi:hypothetical protein
MKGSLKLRPRRVLSRAQAWACFSANLALPGSGSLAAGYAIGYAQMAAAFLAMILSIVASIPMFQWILSGRAMSQTTMDDPFENLVQLWLHARWPMACLGLFVMSLLWATMTSLTILAHAPKDGAPPRIG